MGFALWLLPVGDECDALEHLKEFRPRHYKKNNSSRSYPYFAPHITLATFTTPGFTSLPAILPDSLTEVPVRFESFKTGNTYMGAFGVNIAKTRELVAMGKSIVEHLRLKGIEPKQRGFPHMSLFYVDEPEARHELAQDMISTKRAIAASGESGSTVLLDARDQRFAPISGFTGAQVWLVDCNPKDVNAWRVMDKIQLKRKPSSSPPTSASAPVVDVSPSQRPAASLPNPEQAQPQHAGYSKSHRRPAIDQYYEDRPDERPLTSEDDGYGRSSSGRRPGEASQQRKHHPRPASADRRDKGRGCSAWLEWFIGLFVGERR